MQQQNPKVLAAVLVIEYQYDFEFSQVLDQRDCWYNACTSLRLQQDHFSKGFIHFVGHVWVFSATFNLQKRSLDSVLENPGTKPPQLERSHIMDP